MANQTVTLATYNLILTGTSSCLSILGASLIFVSYFTIREVRNFTRRLLLYLTIADLLTAVGNLVAVIRYAYVNGDDDFVTKNCTARHVTEYKSVCVGQSFVTTFSNMASFLWTSVIAIHLWSSVVLKTRGTEILYMHTLYHVICWLVPFTIVSVLLNKGHLGEDYCFGTGVWCGIKSDLSPHTIRTWMYIADIGWQIACYLTACFLYIHLKFYLVMYHNGSRFAAMSNRLRNEDENFIFVWMIIYLLKLWGFVRFFITSYTETDILNKSSMKGFLNFLLIMQSYGASGQAFWNCILFCFLDKTVWCKMKTWLCFYCHRQEVTPLLDVES